MKLSKIGMSLVLLFTIGSANAFAAPVETEQEKLEELKSSFDPRISELSKKELEIYKTYKGEERQKQVDLFYQSEEVKKLQNEYKEAVLGDPELEKLYIDQIAGNQMEGISLKTNEIVSTKALKSDLESPDGYQVEKIIEHDDGSFSVLTGTLTEHKKDPGAIEPMQYTNGIGDYDFVWDFEYRHLVYPNSHFKIKTYYTTHTTSPHLKVYNATTAGTFGQLPLVTVTGSAKIDQPNATKSTKARTSGNFNITFAGYNGIGLHSENWDGNCSFIIRDYTSTTVTISTEGVFSRG